MRDIKAAILKVFDLFFTLKTRLYNDDIDDGWP